MANERLRMLDRMRGLPLAHERYGDLWGLPARAREMIRATCRAEIEVAAKSPVIIADEIAEMYAMSPKENWQTHPEPSNPVSDFPCVAPPGPAFTVEWNWTGDLVIDGKLEREPPGQIAVVCMALDLTLTDKRAAFPAMATTMISCGGSPESTSAEIVERIKEATDRCRWFILLSPWFASFKSPLCGMAMWGGGRVGVFVDAAGVPIDHFCGGPACREKPDLMNTPKHITLLTLSFMNCKNVVVREAPEQDVTDRKWLRRKRLPGVQYKVLHLSPMREILRREGGMAQHGLRKALHICRGHFRTYDDASPGLFGRLHGTFWIPQHARGDRELGEVVKDYRLDVAEVVR